MKDYLHENCVLCNEKIDDESYANGFWDLAGTIACELNLGELAQDTIYTELRNWFSMQNYCPRCGTPIKEDK